MEDDEKMDLSSLDPSRDAVRWERMIQSVANRAVAARQPAVVIDLYRYARPLLALAAAVAALTWLPALLAEKPGESARSAATSAVASDPVASLSEWAERGEVPASADLFATLGGSDAR
jgi:hypothetical protein